MSSCFFFVGTILLLLVSQNFQRLKKAEDCKGIGHKPLVPGS
ncbi:Fe2OG dioxygenase domain-containing protein [Psidium guajava]|nr:Fe2OG dioxygenase domain-containing protein [Psidium guajava]